MGKELMLPSSAAVVTRLPDDRIIADGVFVTRLLSDNMRDRGQHKFDPMATIGVHAMHASVTDVDASTRDELKFSLVGEDSGIVEIGPGPYFGPPPMITLVTERRQNSVEHYIAKMCRCCEKQ